MAEKYSIVVNKLELELKRMRAEGKTKLPSEKELCSTFSCSRQTVRTALEILEAQGLIVKRRGSGSYLADDTVRNMTVFYITDDCDRYHSPSLISGIKTELASSGYGLKTFSTSGSSSEEASIIKRAIEERTAAVIFEPSHDLIPGPVTRVIEEALDSHIPVIWCNAAYPPEGALCVAPDYRQGSRRLADHLKENGRKNIACIFRMDASIGREGYEGYIDSVFGTELPFEDCGALLLTYSQEKEIISGHEKLLSDFLEKISSCYDALICQNGMLAHQAICLLRKKGISVPEDITVACFDSGCYYRDYGDGMTALGYDNGVISKALAGTACALAEGRTAKDVIVPLKWM